MTHKEALAELIAKVEAGGFDAPPSSARAPFFNAFMDLAEIALPQNVTGCSALAWQAYNMASLDAAKALHEAVLHERVFVEIEWSKRYNDEARVTISLGENGWYAGSGTPARAWLLAILKALHEMENNK